MGKNGTNDEIPDTLTHGEMMSLANMQILLKGKVRIRVTYTNHRGEEYVRVVEPHEVWYGRTPWHPRPCLLLRCLDVDKEEMRDFRMEDFDWTNAEIVNDHL